MPVKAERNGHVIQILDEAISPELTTFCRCVNFSSRAPVGLKVSSAVQSLPSTTGAGMNVHQSIGVLYQFNIPWT